jgi:hypothetical protein
MSLQVLQKVEKIEMVILIYSTQVR